RRACFQQSKHQPSQPPGETETKLAGRSAPSLHSPTNLSPPSLPPSPHRFFSLAHAVLASTASTRTLPSASSSMAEETKQ
uniref:Uncharacterized protein n=1 Tax=Aegilops tauschii subsp. strangulata TaxID=200361 RepID=A0A452Z6J8_AEGTS